MNRRLLKFIVFIVDFLLLQLALYVTLTLRFETSELWEQWVSHFSLFWFLSLIWLTVFYIGDLYNILQPLDHKKLLICISINVALAITFFYVFPNIPITPKTNLGLIVVWFIIFFLLWRNSLEVLLDRLGIKRRLIFIGLDSHSLELAQHIYDNPRLGYVLDGYVLGKDNDRDLEIPSWLKNSSVQKLKDMRELSSYLEGMRTHTIVVSEEWYRSRSIHQHLYNLFPKGVRMYQLSTFWEQLEETIPVNAADELWFLQNMSRGPYTSYHKLKRFFDLCFVLIFSPIFLVFALFTTLLVKLSSRGPVIFSQTRTGLGDRTFTLYKFRSMRIDAEEKGAVWAQENDPRVTPVGNFIRRFRLDELPQLVNVLKGDMSVVGPRPERPEFVEQLAQEIPHYSLRHLVKPGLTGWAQVKYRYGASVEDAERKLMYDLYYVKNISPVLDIKIALKTILTIVSRNGR